MTNAERRGRAGATGSGDVLLPVLAALAGVPGGLAVVERRAGAGAASPLHVHEADEAFSVLEGELTIHAGDEVVRLRAGETYVAPAGVPHAHRAGSEGARYRAAALVRSVARYEDFLRAEAAPAAGWSAPEEERALAAIAAANAITLVGAPGALAAATGSLAA